MQNAFIILGTGIPKPPKDQGWEFTHRLSEQMAHFQRKNKQMSDLLKEAICSFAHFW